MKAMMTAMMTAAIKRCLFIFLPSACLSGLGLRTRLSGAPRHWGLGGGAQLPKRINGLHVPRLGELRPLSSCFRRARVSQLGRARQHFPPTPRGWGFPEVAPSF